MFFALTQSLDFITFSKPLSLYSSLYPVSIFFSFCIILFVSVFVLSITFSIFAIFFSIVYLLHCNLLNNPSLPLLRNVLAVRVFFSIFTNCIQFMRWEEGKYKRTLIQLCSKLYTLLKFSLDSLPILATFVIKSDITFIEFYSKLALVALITKVLIKHTLT